MSTDWPRVPLGEVLTPVVERLKLSPLETYREVTVKWWGKGLAVRREMLGAETATAERVSLQPGQFIISRIDALHGASGVVPDALAGGVVTNDFPVYAVNESRLVPAFLDWYSKTAEFVELCRRASEGTTNRIRLKEDRFRATAIPLPPLAEQRRIVERVGAVASRIAEANRLALASQQEARLLVPQGAHNTFEELETKYTIRRFADFKPHVTSGPRNWATRYVDGGTRFYRAQDLLPEGRITHSGKVYIDLPESNQGRGAQLQIGDLMLVITGATVGRVAEYTEGLETGYVSQHVAICRLPLDAVVPRFALWRLLSTSGQTELVGQRYGQGKPGLNLTNIRNLTLPVPPIPEQRRIVARLDVLQAKADALRALQAETATALDALLPSVLNRAFAGEL